MAKILFLTHRMPYPPDKGDKIRAFNILEHLSARHAIWLGAISDHGDLRHLDDVRRRCRDVYIGVPSLPGIASRLSVAALNGAPFSVARFRHGGLMRWVRRVLDDVKPDVAFVFSSAMAQYVLERPAATGLVVDFVDADAEKWRAYAERLPPPRKWIYASEFRRLIRFDARAAASARACLFVSETERRLFAGFVPAVEPLLHVIPNGVDTAYFQPLPEPRPDGPPAIVFSGAMDYIPNIDAVTWFTQDILPRVRAEWPEAVFRIVGARPSPAVHALAALPGVEVVGAVPDMRPYLHDAAVIVAPLRIARGIQNKVLEGMAMGRPLVVTPEALDGVEAQPGVHLLVASDAPSYARAVGDILAGRASPSLGHEARAHVVAQYRWAAQLAALDRLIDGIALTPDRG